MTENVCVRCGETYLVAAEYKGHYCPECREEWRDRESSDPKPAGSTGRRSRRRYRDEGDTEESDPEAEAEEDPEGTDGDEDETGS